jgi:hypothetical protein
MLLNPLLPIYVKLPMADKETTTNPSETNSSLFFLLKEGPNTFGSHARNNFVFPPNVASFAGIFFLKNNRVHIRTSEAANITHNGQPIDDAVIYEPGNSKQLEIGALKVEVIENSGRLGVILKHQ